MIDRIIFNVEFFDAQGIAKPAPYREEAELSNTRCAPFVDRSNGDSANSLRRR